MKKKSKVFTAIMIILLALIIYIPLSCTSSCHSKSIKLPDEDSDYIEPEPIIIEEPAPLPEQVFEPEAKPEPIIIEEPAPIIDGPIYRTIPKSDTYEQEVISEPELLDDYELKTDSEPVIIEEPGPVATEEVASAIEEQEILEEPETFLIEEPAPVEEPVVEEIEVTIEEEPVPAEEEPEPVIKREEKKEPIPEKKQKPEPVAEKKQKAEPVAEKPKTVQKPEVDEAEYKRSTRNLSKNGETISKDEFSEDKAEILRKISELQDIMNRKDFEAWVKYISPESKRFYSRARRIRYGKDDEKISSGLKDYFFEIFIPARKQSKVKEIRYISRTSIKAVDILGEGKILTYYNFVKIDGSWYVQLPENIVISYRK